MPKLLKALATANHGAKSVRILTVELAMVGDKKPSIWDTIAFTLLWFTIAETSQTESGDAILVAGVPARPMFGHANQLGRFSISPQTILTNVLALTVAPGPAYSGR